MKTVSFLVSALALSAGAQSFVSAAAATPEDAAYFERNRKLIAVEWTEPFGYESVRSKDAPIGPYLGNGDVGAVAWTSAFGQTLRLSKVDFVTDAWRDWAGDGAAALPAGEVEIAVKDDAGEGFRYEMDQFTATLSMRTGTKRPVSMKTWLAPDANVVVVELANASSEAVPIAVKLRPIVRPGFSVSAATSGAVAQIARRTKSGDGARWVSQVGVSAKIVGAADVRVSREGNGTLQEFTLGAGACARVAVRVSGGGRGDDSAWAEARRALDGLDERGIAAMRERHQSWWNEMWTRSYVDSGDALLNGQYLTSIYLMASAYSPKSPACGGMYGVWNMEDGMMYHGDIHLNYNSQGGFYSMFSANRPELALPFFDFLEKMMPEGRRRAREEMGEVHPSLAGKSCRGLLFPVSALGIGEFYGGYWQQTMDAPFNVPLWSWYYEYTGDAEFLRERAYPFIRECGDFYEDFLRREPYGDSYRYCITTGAHENSWDLNPPSELAIVEATFRLLLRYSETLGVDSGRRALWRDILDHLPEYRVVMPTKEPNEGKPVFAKNEDGWDWPAHVIQMHCAFPCETLNLNSDSELLEIGRNTLRYYGVSQRGFTETMNELGLSAFVMGARVGLEPEILLDAMRVLASRRGKNLLIRDGHHCLEKTAVVETLNSMMLQSVDGALRLFPCWPAAPASFTRLRAKGAFVVSAKYDGRETSELTIESARGNVCRLVNPWRGREVVVTTSAGARVAVSADGDVVSFRTVPGATYALSPKR